MRRMKWVGVLLLAVALTGCGHDGKEQEVQETVSDIVVPSVIDVYGEVIGGNESEIVVGFPAIVEEVHVKEGQKLSKGDKIITLDIDEYLLRIEQQKIAIASSNMDSLDPMIRSTALEIDLLNRELATKKNHLNNGTDAQVQALRSNIEIMQSELEQEMKVYEVNKELHEIGAISDNEMETYQLAIHAKESAIKDLETQVASYEEAMKSEIDALNTQINIKNEMINNYRTQQSSGQEQLDYQVESMRLELEYMQNQLDKAYLEGNNIVAKEDNVVITGINVVEGSSVSSVTGPVVRMVSVDPLEVKIEIPEDLIGEVSVGDKAEVVFYTPNGEDSYQGEVSWIAESAIEKSGDTIVEGIVTLTEDTDLKIGMSVEVMIEK